MRIGSGLDSFARVPVEDVIDVRSPVVVGREELDLLVSWERIVRAVRIGEMNLVRRGRVFGEEVNPFLFHETADEIEIRLAILHDELPARVRPREGEFEIGEAVAPEDLFEDVGHRLVLKDAAIGGAAEKPEPGAKRDSVPRVR